MKDCIFCKIIDGKIPSTKIYEDDKVLAFLDISPVNKGHVLIVSKEHTEDFLSMSEKNINDVFLAAQKIAEAVMKGTNAEGFNLGMNNKPAAGQVVFHSHLHIIPRFKKDGLHLWGSRGPYTEGEAAKVAENIREKL